MTCTLFLPISMEPSFILSVISRSMAFMAVPASEPLRPWFAIMDMAADVVSTSRPAACAFAAQFLKAMPRPSTVVFALAWE